MATNKWYSIRRTQPQAKGEAAPMPSAEVFIYGDIGESWCEETVTAAQFVKDLAALGPVESLTVRINSIGGSVPDGLAIYNAIKRHPAATRTACIDGMAMSVASLISMAGDTVEMAENAILMIHAPWTFAAGNAVELREQADTLDVWARAMATSYAAKTGLTVEEMLLLLTDGEDHYYTADEAIAAGFADAVVAGLPIAASLDTTRFAARPHAVRTIAAAAAQPEEQSMTTQTPAAPQPQAANPNPQDAEAIRAAALAADQARRDQIEADFAPFAAHPGAAKLMAKCQKDPAMSAETAGKELLALLAKDKAPVGNTGTVEAVEDQRDKLARAASAALMARAAVRDRDGKVIAVERGNPFAGQSLMDMARASLARAGFRTDGLDKMQVVAAAFTQTGSDFPVLLESAMHKTLQAAYATQSDTWSRFCAVGSVSDFRAHKRYRVGSIGTLQTVNEAGEFKNITIPDGESASITAITKGGIINLTRQAIINDDLGAFIGLASNLGRAARRTIEAAVYAALAENSGLGPTMGDTYSLFHANHGNIGTGAAISAASLDGDRVKMASQTDVGGNDYLDLSPAVLLLPIGLGGQARVINQSQYDPDTLANKGQMKPNIVVGLFRDVVDTPRLTGTRRYLFADPAVAPVLEVAFLDGMQEPFLELQNGFEVDGARYKARLDFGVAAVDYRGAVTNAGA